MMSFFFCFIGWKRNEEFGIETLPNYRPSSLQTGYAVLNNANGAP